MNINRCWYLGAIAGIGMLSFACTARKDDPQVQVAKPKDATPKDAKSEFAAIEQEYQKDFQDLSKKIRELESRAEMKKQADEKFPKLLEPFAERVFALEKQYPESPESTKALMWLLGITQNKDLRTKLTSQLNEKLAKVEIKELPSLLGNPNPAWGAIGVAAFNKIKDLPTDPNVEKIAIWVAHTTMYGGPDGVNETYNKAIEMLVDKYPQSSSFLQLAGPLSTDDNPKWAAEQFRKLIDKNKDGDNRLIGQFGLGSMICNEEGKEKEATELLESFVKEAKEKSEWQDLFKLASVKLKDLKLINHPIQEITGEDLDGKVFKISDYKGKVVLLDFWGFW